MMKKMVALMIAFSFAMIPMASYADIADSRQILTEYAELLKGEWELLNYTDFTEKWKTLPASLTIRNDKGFSVNALGQVYYQWSTWDYMGNGGEVLLTSSDDLIGFTLLCNGNTTVAYYQRKK